MTQKDLIQKIGLSPSQKGYNYMIRALQIAKEMDGKEVLITKDIYPEIAREHGKTISAIEKSIERLIKKLDPAAMNFYFGNSVPVYDIPKPKQFIMTIAKYD